MDSHESHRRFRNLSKAEGDELEDLLDLQTRKGRAMSDNSFMRMTELLRKDDPGIQSTATSIAPSSPQSVRSSMLREQPGGGLSTEQHRDIARRYNSGTDAVQFEQWRRQGAAANSLPYPPLDTPFTPPNPPARNYHATYAPASQRDTHLNPPLIPVEQRQGLSAADQARLDELTTVFHHRIDQYVKSGQLKVYWEGEAKKTQVEIGQLLLKTHKRATRRGTRRRVGGEGSVDGLESVDEE